MGPPQPFNRSILCQPGLGGKPLMLRKGLRSPHFCGWCGPVPGVHDARLLIADMAGAAAAGDRPCFDRLTHEMLGGDVRERLFLSLALLTEAIAEAPAQS